MRGITMPNNIKILLMEYLSEIRTIYGKHLKSVILYGSYARGDYTSDSDVDIMILVDLTEEEIEKLSEPLSELGFEYNVDHDIWMMPIVKNIDHFNQWVSTYPFYNNIQNEGVRLYDGCGLSSTPDS